MTIIYCIITLLVVYYLALWGWYRHADNKAENSAGGETLPENENPAGYTLIGESRYKGGQTHSRTKPDTSRKRLKMILFLRRMPPEQTKRPAMGMTNRTTRTRKSPGTWRATTRVGLRA